MTTTAFVLSLNLGNYSTADQEILSKLNLEIL